MSEYIIETHNLTKRYGNQVSVSNLNIHVKQGRIYGLLGRNGAGKTTTMRMLLGLTAPTSGEVKIFGRPMQGNENKILPRIGCLIESPGFYPNLTATENLRIFAELRGINKPNYIKDALELVNLPYRDKKLFSEYSLGMKQRLAIALAVMHEPEVLILDEPINGLDPIGIAEVRSFIRELCDARGKTILISSHILSEISLLADDIGIIDRGVLLEEESLKELEAKNAKFVHFIVSDASKAAQIISKLFQTRNMQIADSYNLYLYDTTLPVAKINRALLLLAETGFRIGELLGVRYGEDIDYKNHVIYVNFREDNENNARAKNAEFRRAKISDATFDILTFYIEEYKELILKQEYLFINVSGDYAGKPFKVSGVYAMLRRLEEKTGIKASPHMLRHYFANERRKDGWKLELISQALGHRNIETTMKYLNITDEELIQVSDEFYSKHQAMYGIQDLL